MFMIQQSTEAKYRNLSMQIIMLKSQGLMKNRSRQSNLILFLKAVTNEVDKSNIYLIIQMGP